MIRKFSCFIISIFIISNLVAQPTYPNTFLWRVTGNGLTKPSYLYGTMHLQDRKLFSFGDSVYNAIELSEGFAIEINPLEMMDSVLKIFSNQDKSPLVKNILGKEKFDKVAARLEKKLKIPADRITLKKINDERNNWWVKSRRKDDMQTFLDMYLYTIAQNQGKYVGGIEDIGDQIGLFDDVGAVDIDEYLKEDDKIRWEYLERMKSIYLNRDLNKIYEMTYGEAGTREHDLVLIKRNVKMARRIDSLSHIRNTFFAIGAAHLPGDSGVITLLRKRGFLVDPIHSSRYIKPEDYHYTIKEAKWLRIEDENNMGSVEMPGQPTIINLDDVIPMKLFVDLSTMYFYGMAVMPTGDQNEDTVLSKIAGGYKSMGFDVIATKKIKENGNKGLDMIVRSEEYYLKFRVLIKSNKLFMLIFGAQDLEKLNAPQGIKFFNSLLINETNITSGSSWQLLSDSTNAFSLLMPGKPIYKFEKGTEETSYDVSTYTATDFSDGSFYNVTIQNIIPGYFIQDDSAIFAGLKSRFDILTDSGTVHISEVFLNGYRAYKLVGEKKDKGVGYVFQILMIPRGNRIYIPMAVTEKSNQNSEAVNTFFKNLTFLPYRKSQWQQYASPLNDFRTWAPAKLEFKEQDTLLTANNKKYIYAHDKNTLISFGVEIQPYSRFYWSNSDSLFFKSLANTFKSEQDSLVNYQLISGDMPGADVLIKVHNSDLYKKLRATLNGDTLYTLYAHIPKDLLEDKDVNLFFSGLQFQRQVPNTIFTNKQDILMSALHNNDSLVRDEAIKVLEQLRFTKSNLAFLHDAWLRSYPKDPGEYRTINYYFGEKIAELKDTATIDFIDKNYMAINAAAELQMNMLEVLAGFKNRYAYSVLKKLLLQHPPKEGSIYSLSNALSDSLLLSRSLFPELSQLYTDSITGSALVRLTVDLLDSNLMDVNEVKKHAELVYALSRMQLRQLKNVEEYPLFTHSVLEILGRINSVQSIEYLKRFLQVKDKYFKYLASMVLIKINQPVPSAVLNTLAADNEYRTELFTSLKKINKENLFPREYYNQQKFAESHIYNYVYEDADSVSMLYVGERVSKLNGQLKRYYLFKVTLVQEEGKTAHLAVSGPFDLNKKLVDNDDLQVNVFYDEVYNSSSVEKLFREFMKSEMERVSGSTNK